MPSEERTAVAVEAIRPRVELFNSALATTSEQIRGLLAGTGESPEDQTVALGNFAAGHVDVERFSSFTRRPEKVEAAVEEPIRAAQRALDDLLHMSESLFVLELDKGANLGAAVSERLAAIGNAFSAAHVVELAKRGRYREEDHGHLLDGLPYADWSHAERELAPGLVIQLGGSDFTPAQVAPYLDAGMKLVFVVTGDAPAAALARLVTPGTFVQQVIEGAALDTFAAWNGTAVAAVMPKGAVSFVHDPAAGDTSFERFTTLEMPKEIRRRNIGGISPAQQSEDLQLLESMAVIPSPAGEAASDPAGKLSAWLLSQTSLASDG